MFFVVDGSLDRDLDRIWAFRRGNENEFLGAFGLVMGLSNRLHGIYNRYREDPQYKRTIYGLSGRLIRIAGGLQNVILDTNRSKTR